MVPVDLINNGPGGLVMVVPITSTAYGLRSHIEVETGSSGLSHASYARCDHVRVISVARMRQSRGLLSYPHLIAIEDAMRFILGL